MNAQRRKQLERAIDLLSEARIIVEMCQEEEENCFDNLPASLQESDMGCKMEEAYNTLDDISSELWSQEEAINDVIAA